MRNAALCINLSRAAPAPFRAAASFAEICSGQVAKTRDFLDLYAVTALRGTFARVCPRDKLQKIVTFQKMVTRERFN